MRQHTRSRRSGATPAERYGQLPAAVAEAAGDPGLWGVYALLDLLAGRSGWIRTTRLALAGRTHWTPRHMGRRLVALEALDLVRAEPDGRRATIYRTLRRSGDGRGAHGRLPEAAVAASRLPQLWGLLAWLDLQALAGGGLFQASYAEIGERVGWSAPWAAKCVRELEAHGLLATEGSGLHQTIVPLPAPRDGPLPDGEDADGGGPRTETLRQQIETLRQQNETMRQQIETLRQQNETLSKPDRNPVSAESDAHVF